MLKQLYLAAAKDVLPEFASEEIAKKLDILADCLRNTGSKMNLTAITEPEAVVWLHLIDSLYAAKTLLKISHTLDKNSVADVGSGAGFPALPIAVALTEFQITAIDSTEKKCAYIRSCAEEAGIKNISAVSARAEEYGRTDARESFGAVTARAVARLPMLMELCLPLLKVGGVFAAMKGSDAAAEVAEAENASKILGARLEDEFMYTLPGYADDRRILIFRKISATSDKYPRQFAKISKSPL